MALNHALGGHIEGDSADSEKNGQNYLFSSHPHLETYQHELVIPLRAPFTINDDRAGPETHRASSGDSHSRCQTSAGILK